MPYIAEKQRMELVERPIETAGELSYCLSQTISSFMEAKGFSYQTYNDIVGALEGLKLEIARRFLGPYEDEKRRLNGDVF